MSSMTINALQDARKKATDSLRISTLKNLQVALELYYNDHGSYPVSGGGGLFWIDSAHNPTDWIPGLSPTYIRVLPQEPDVDDTLCKADDPPAPDGNGTSYRYRSDGQTYKIHDHCPPITPGMTRTNHPLYHCPANGGAGHPFSWSVCSGPGCPNIWCDATD